MNVLKRSGDNLSLASTYTIPNTDNVKKTINEWEKETGITVIDHEGFDRTNPDLYTLKFTREEFMKGAMRSTCSWPKHFFK